MLDKSWLKNLAGAHYVGESWQTANPDKVAAQTKSKVSHYTDDLFDRLKDTVELFNEFANREREIHILPMSASNTPHRGFMVLMGRYQLRVVQKENKLELYSVSMDGFYKQEKTLLSLRIEVDALGMVMWSNKDVGMLNQDMLVHFIMETLVKTVSQNNPPYERGSLEDKV